MASWEPIDIRQFDRDDIEDVYDEWGDDFKSNLEIKEFNETLNESTDEDTVEIMERNRNAFKCSTIEMIANEIYDKLTNSFNNNRKRFGIQKGKPIVEPIYQKLR